MAAQKFLANVIGRLTEIAATVTSAGSADDGKIVALDATGKLDSTLMPAGIGADTQTIQASENLAAGDYVNVHNSGGARARKADGSVSGKEANGFVLAAVTSGQNATVYPITAASNTQVTGKTPGARQYLSAATPGATTETAPSGAGNVVQFLGVASSSTTIVWSPDAVILAS